MPALKKLKSKKKPALATAAPKPQIPTILGSLRREREKARSLVDGLEIKLSPVLRSATALIGSATESFSDGAPVAQALAESVSIIAGLNARLKDITARVEL